MKTAIIAKHFSRKSNNENPFGRTGRVRAGGGKRQFQPRGRTARAGQLRRQPYREAAGRQTLRQPAQPHHAPTAAHRRRLPLFRARAADTARHRSRRSRNPLRRRRAAGRASGGFRHAHAAAPRRSAGTPVLRTLSAGVAAAHFVRRLHRPHRAARGHRHPRRQPVRLCLARPPSV